MSHVTENILTLFRSTVLFCNTFEREREKKNVMHVIFLSHTVQSVRGHEKMEELVLNLNNFFGTNWCFFTIQEFSIHLFFFRNTSSYLSKKKKTVDDLRHGEQSAVKSGTWQRLDVSLCSIDGDPLPRWRLFSSRPHEFCALCRHCSPATS